MKPLKPVKAPCSSKTKFFDQLADEGMEGVVTHVAAGDKSTAAFLADERAQQELAKKLKLKKVGAGMGFKLAE